MSTNFDKEIFEYIYQQQYTNALHYIEKLLQVEKEDKCSLYILRLVVYQSMEDKQKVFEAMQQFSSKCTGSFSLRARQHLELKEYKKAECFFELAYIYEITENTTWSRDIILPLWAYTLCKLKKFDKAEEVIGKETTLSADETTMFFTEKNFSYITKSDIYQAIKNKSTYFPRV